MRGEGTGAASIRSGRRGSSPHARGGRPRTSGSSWPPRLIPACAGRASACPPPGTPAGAHPRMLGEGDPCTIGRDPPGGSSPHARGGLDPAEHEPLVLGLIPACAGRAADNHYQHGRHGAHPRMRGEGLVSTKGNAYSGGSSPHARGGRPARVPRGLDQGSSPHARGGQRPPNLGTGLTGLIPAWAGRAGSSCRNAHVRAAHPRMRGEGHAFEARHGIDAGSSPHARGGQVS